MHLLRLRFVQGRSPILECWKKLLKNKPFRENFHIYQRRINWYWCLFKPGWCKKMLAVIRRLMLNIRYTYIYLANNSYFIKLGAPLFFCSLSHIREATNKNKYLLQNNIFACLWAGGNKTSIICLNILARVEGSNQPDHRPKNNSTFHFVATLFIFVKVYIVTTLHYTINISRY